MKDSESKAVKNRPVVFRKQRQSDHFIETKPKRFFLHYVTNSFIWLRTFLNLEFLISKFSKVIHFIF